MELTDEEKAALIAALDGGPDDDLTIKQWQRLADLGLVVWEHAWELTPAGQIVATLLKRESRLERLLDDARVCFVADTVMTEQQVRIRDRVEYAVEATTRDPDATIEASKRTPWPVEE